MIHHSEVWNLDTSCYIAFKAIHLQYYLHQPAPTHGVYFIPQFWGFWIRALKVTMATAWRDGLKCLGTLTLMCFWHFLRVYVGVGANRVTVWAPVSFPHLLQPVETFVRLPQPVLAVDHRNFNWQSSFGFESTSATSAQQQNTVVKKWSEETSLY